MSVTPGNPTEQTHEDRQTHRTIVIGFIVWFLHQNSVYSLNSIACRWSWFPNTIAGMPRLRFVQVVLSLVAAGALIFLIYLPWRQWRRYQTDEQHMLHDTETNRRPLVAFIAMTLNTLFLLFVIAAFVPILTLNACA